MGGEGRGGGGGFTHDIAAPNYKTRILPTREESDRYYRRILPTREESDRYYTRILPTREESDRHYTRILRLGKNPTVTIQESCLLGKNSCTYLTRILPIRQEFYLLGIRGIRVGTRWG